jgi:hypothetical protein
MIPVICHTNLDLAGECWPTALPAVPSVGHHIQSRTSHDGFQLQLQVVRVTWEYARGVYFPHLELGMTETQKKLPATTRGAETGSIVAFYEWYAPLVGQSVSSFI